MNPINRSQAVLTTAPPASFSISAGVVDACALHDKPTTKDKTKAEAIALIFCAFVLMKFNILIILKSVTKFYKKFRGARPFNS